MKSINNKNSRRPLPPPPGSIVYDSSPVQTSPDTTSPVQTSPAAIYSSPKQKSKRNPNVDKGEVNYSEFLGEDSTISRESPSTYDRVEYTSVIPGEQATSANISPNELQEQNPNPLYAFP